MRTQADKEQNKKEEKIKRDLWGKSCPLITITAEANSS
jgi:hypothetical protein